MQPSPCGKIAINEIKLDRSYEVVERKGAGHPDTLADELAEELSVAYARYTLEKYGAILHHNFDKVGLLGGASFVKFGEGHLTSPIRVLINGRVSTHFGADTIPHETIIEITTKDYLKRKFPYIDTQKDIIIYNNISTRSSPGKTDLTGRKEGTRKNFFTPRGKQDLGELTFLAANDTSVGTGFAPLTTFEQMILNLETSFSEPSFRKEKPWLGTDIKIMGFKTDEALDVTVCIPQISRFVESEEHYKSNLLLMRNYIEGFLHNHFSNLPISLHINTRDNFETGELYLTAIGSSIESGDEGLVGRGNRVNRLICQTKPYTMEGIAGKNPVYHVGKLYSLKAQEIANQTAEQFKSYCEVFLISQSGRLLIDPWQTIVGIEHRLTPSEKKDLTTSIQESLKTIPLLTARLLRKECPLA